MPLLSEEVSGRRQSSRQGCQVSWLSVSRHLSQLKAAGIVEDEKRGKMIFYRLRVKCLTNFFGCIESVVQNNVKCQQDLLTG